MTLPKQGTRWKSKTPGDTEEVFLVRVHPYPNSEMLTGITYRVVFPAMAAACQMSTLDVFEEKYELIEGTEEFLEALGSRYVMLSDGRIFCNEPHLDTDENLIHTVPMEGEPVEVISAAVENHNKQYHRKPTPEESLAAFKEKLARGELPIPSGVMNVGAYTVVYIGKDAESTRQAQEELIDVLTDAIDTWYNGHGEELVNIQPEITGYDPTGEDDVR
ncbi:hypothetical protein [Streptomyces sp. NPDC006477]|uniref:hypothetical protein n=1 Tax=Streptomyces sp. NPDC006477 TaxID=3364747 RepID=UPI00369E7F7C